MERPADLRIENRRRFWSITFPRFAPILAAVLGIELLLFAFFEFDRRDAETVLLLFLRGAVVVGLAIIAWEARRGSQVEALEFSDRFRFFERGGPIAFDWNQIAAMWYEGVRNSARVRVTTTKPSATEDRVLIVGLCGGAEVRIRAAPDQQGRVLEWARFIESMAGERIAS